MSYFGKFLLIENDAKTLDLVYRDKSLMDKHPCSVARSVSEAKKLIENSGKEFRMVFVSERAAKIADLTEFKKVTDTFPELKLVLIEFKDPHPPAREMIPARIEPLKSFMDLVKVIEAEVSEHSDWRKNEDDGQEKDKEIAAQDEKYVEVSMRDFVITPKSFFNFYLRLSAGRYIKIFKAGDPLTKEEIERYQAKGIDEFFVPKEEHEKFVRLQGTLATKVVSSDASSGFKIKTLMKLGANVTNNLLRCGITPDRMDNAQVFLDQSVTLLRHMKMKDEVITNFLKNIDTDEHTAAVAFIAGILANSLGFESTKSIKVVGTAALLHDIGLYDLDPDFNEGDENNDPKKKEVFDKHALHGADILRRTGTFDEVICHAIENHHRRRKGENANRRSTSVNLVTEIVSVADEFFNTVISKGYSPEKVKFFMEIELKNYSPNVEKAFHVLTKGKKAA